MHRLALGLGCMVCELDERMPSSEVTAWLAYYKIEPFGAERDNWHMATLASILANTHRKKGSPVIQPTDFMYIDSTTAAEKKALTFAAGMKRRAKKGK